MPGRILIVEDDESIRTVFAHALRQQSIELDELADGGPAVEAIRSGRYDVVVLDLRLPEKDGFEILRVIRDDRKKPVILALSASTEDVRRVAGDRSVMMCINKNFALNNLEPVIAAIAAVTQVRQ
jgi:DNA-binding response OmpR family regulator